MIRMMTCMSDFMVGYDYKLLSELGIKVPIEVSPESHTIIVGGSGSGKSTALLYFLYKMMKSNHIQLTICDFKASHERLAQPVCAQDTRRKLAPAVCGGIAESGLCGIPAG